jgi:lipopolysaccharide transport system ATP-binding protein
LSRITEPTVGRVRLRGRVASLLEVGTGFHPELTGRENIVLNGCILGMKRAEVRRKFDEIVAFAEVENFIDTPVKRYSSGMYVRLAFAVAAHLEPEILVIDEVLAVGDATFQQKALAKMEDVSGSGRTVLFVSHNMTAIQSLCGRVIQIESGQVKSQGDPAAEVKKYLTSASPQQTTNRSVRAGDSLVINDTTFSPNPVESRSDIQFSLTFMANHKIRLNSGVLSLYALTGERIALIDLRSILPLTIETDETFKIQGLIRSLPLVEGRYKWTLWLDAGRFQGYIRDLAELIVSPAAKNSLFAPIPPERRGWLEFDSEINVQRSKDLLRAPINTP